MTRRPVLALLATLLLAGAALAAGDYPDPRGFVNDFANLLDGKTAGELEASLRGVRDRSVAEIAVVTVESLGGRSVEEYTVGLANQWGVGNRQRDDGIVLLVAPKERRVRIEVGYSLEKRLTDLQASRIIEERIRPLFREGDMRGGILAGVGGIYEALGLGAPAFAPPPPPAGRQPGKGAALLVAGVVGLLILLAFAGLRAGRRGGGRRRRGRRTPGDSFVLFGGGGWTSGSAGGFSGGGFGGGFGGGGFGGGSFGGGGASGSW